MDARHPLQIGPFLEGPNGNLTAAPSGYLVQGGRTEFLVVNRKFLAEYTISVDGVTTLQDSIEDLDEAASLTTPLSSTSAPVSKGAARKVSPPPATSRNERPNSSCLNY